MKILMFISRYGPSVQTSGPAISVRETVETLADEHDIAIVSRDGPGGGRPDDFPVNRWGQLGPARIFYADKHWRRFDRIVNLLREERPDLIYINSYFDHRANSLPLLALRFLPGLNPAVLLAPRGEMAQSALRIKKFKKSVYRSVSSAMGLHRGITLHASGPEDGNDIAEEFEGYPMGEALDIGIAPPPIDVACERDAANRLRLVFMGRINPMKNIDYALDVLALCKEAVQFDIIGPVVDPDYRDLCEAKRKALPDNIDAQFLDPVPHDRVFAELAARDLLFMPSRAENFCHAIHESLSVGTPVLVSERTNWTPYLGKDLSWVIAAHEGPAAIAKKIDALARESVQTRQARRLRLLADNPAQRVREKAIADTKRLFKETLERHRAA